MQKERAAKEKQAAEQAALARNRQMLEADEDDSDDSEDSSDSEDEADDVERALSGEGGGEDANSMQVDKPDIEAKTSRRRRGKGSSLNGDGQDTKDWSRSLGLGMDLDAVDEGGTKQFLSFDIYLKGNVSKATSFFKSAGGKEGAQRFRMYPYVEKRRKVDAYGEILDVGMWVRRGKILEEDTDETRQQKEKEEEAKVSLSRQDEIHPY